MSNTITAVTDVPPEIAWIFQKTPLLIGESTRAYDGICMALIRSIGPQHHLEWLLLKQVLDLYWEIHRWTKFKSDIVNMSWREALRQAFESIIEGEDDDRRCTAQKHVDEWYSTPAAQESTRRLLLKHGIDEEAITTQAMALRLPELEMIDKRLERARVSQMATLREIEHYRVAGTWQAGKGLQQIVDAEVSSIIPAPLVPRVVNAR